MQKIVILALLLSSFTLLGQEEISPIKDLKTGNISEQFEYINEISNNYLKYKVVDQDLLKTIKNNIIDSVQNLESEISNLKNQLNSRNQEISKLDANVKTAQSSMDLSNKEKDSILFFGSLTPKKTYKSIMWGIVIVLALVLAFYIFVSYKNSVGKKEANSALLILQEEFDSNVKRSLEKEQFLMRELQDLKNKTF